MTHLHIIPNSKILHRWEKWGKSCTLSISCKKLYSVCNVLAFIRSKDGYKTLQATETVRDFPRLSGFSSYAPVLKFTWRVFLGYFFASAPLFEMSLQKIRPCAVAGIADQTICLAKQIPSGERSWSAAPVQRAFIKNWDSARWLHKIFNIQ